MELSEEFYQSVDQSINQSVNDIFWHKTQKNKIQGEKKLQNKCSELL